MPYIQFVMGPAGSGKSTYCASMQSHAATKNQVLHVANLDPAAEVFHYDVAFDIRELINVEEVMEELALGPNGGLIYCMEYLVTNFDWLREKIEEYDDDEMIVLDCPGQLELYTHVPIMKTVIDNLRSSYEGKMVASFCLDAGFLMDTSKFLSGSLLSLSAMIALELPHINILTKADMVDEEELDRILDRTSAVQMWEDNQRPLADSALERRRQARNRLSSSISQLLDDYSMVSFVPLNIQEEDSMDHVSQVVSHSIQFGEDQEVRTD